MKRLRWLVLAVLLLGVSAWLMSRGERDKDRSTTRDRVHFPRGPSARDDQRAARRRRLIPPPSASAAPAVARDPLFLALPNNPGRSTVVFEAAAIKDSPIGRHLVDCMLGEREADGLADLKRDYAIDPLEDVQRFAFSGDVAVVEGDFGSASWAKLAQDWISRPYGDAATIYTRPQESQSLAVVGDGMVLFGKDAGEVESAIDRLEGRLPPAAPAIPEWAMYGDVYGVLAVETLAEMIPKEGGDERLADAFRSAVEQVELHVDTSDDVAIVADVVGAHEEEVADLGKSLGAALSIARLRAQTDDDERLADLLELARVSPHKGRFSLDLALPMDVLKKTLGPCKRQGGGRAR